MYRALHEPSGQEIIILSKLWAGQADYLRELGQQDLLVCPGCRRPVQPRLGDVRIWHFAHKHLENCPFENESPELLASRAALYTWLSGQAGEEDVTLEMPLTPRLRHPLDCTLKTSGAGFWIFDRRMPPDEREILASASAGRAMTWLFTANQLNIEPGRPDLLYLTTTEREFMAVTPYDEAWHNGPGAPGKTLHYLDASAGRLLTYRDLFLHHAPQCFHGHYLESPLTEVLLADSQPVHNGEERQLAWRRQALEDAHQKEQDRLGRAREKLQRLTGGMMQAPAGQKQAAAQTVPYARSGTCRGCGKITSEWVTYFGGTQECLCRDCADRQD